MSTIRRSFIFLLAGCLWWHQPTYAQERIKIAYSSADASNAIWYLALDAGLYRKHGLEVELVFIQCSTTSVSSVVAGDIQVANTSGGAVASAAGPSAASLVIQEWKVEYGGRPRDPYVAPDGKVWYLYYEQYPGVSYGLSVADNFVRGGQVKHALVVGAAVLDVGNAVRVAIRTTVELGQPGLVRAAILTVHQPVPIAVALIDAGVPELRLVNRTLARAQTLAAELEEAARERDATLSVLPWQDGTALAGGSLLVNTTSLGMTGQPPLQIDLAPLPAQALVTDIVYNPLETGLLAAARARGHVVVDGLGMLLHQARPGFRAWFGTDPQVTPDLRAFVAQGL